MQVVNRCKQLLLIACGKINHDASKRVKIWGPDFFFRFVSRLVFLSFLLLSYFFAPLLIALGVWWPRKETGQPKCSQFFTRKADGSQFATAHVSVWVCSPSRETVKSGSPDSDDSDLLAAVTKGGRKVTL